MEPDAEAIKQLATDVNNVADASFQAGYKAGLKKAFEPDGPVDKLVKALEGMISRADLLEEDEGFVVCVCREWEKEDCNYCRATKALDAYRKVLKEKQG